MKAFALTNRMLYSVGIRGSYAEWSGRFGMAELIQASVEGPKNQIVTFRVNSHLE